MMREEIQFLKDLQEELKTQNNDCQASPRFWVLMDYRVVPAHEEYGAERTSYFHNDGDHTEFQNVNELKEFLDEHYLEDDEFGKLKEVLDNNNTDFEELWEFVNERLNDDGFFSAARRSLNGSKSNKAY